MTPRLLTCARATATALLATALIVTPLPAAHDAVAAAGAYDAVVDITFPVAGSNSYVDSYHAPRSGGARVHKATDVMAPYGARVHAARGGVVSWISGIDSPVSSSGYIITIAGDDGRSYSYIHLGRQDAGPQAAYAPGIRRGTKVQRGQLIGYNGCSGNASCSAPHLHFEISDPSVDDPYGTHRMNPYASLRDAQRRGDLPGATPSPAPEPEPKVDECAPTGSVPATPVRRLTGKDPVATSVAVSAAGWSSADRVLIARADDFADALAGAAVSAEWGAPLLLVGDRLADVTRAELQRLGVRRATILGGVDAVPPAVEAAIDAVVADVDRIAGQDRFATAAAVRGKVGYAGDEVALALGRHPNPRRSWPDAISAGGLAGGPVTIPVLLTLPTRLPDHTHAALVAARKAGSRTVLVVGGPEAIDPGVEQAVASLGYSVKRLAGPTRYETSIAVAKAAVARRADTPRTVVAASGLSPVDALPASTLAARTGGSLVLVPPCNLDTLPDLGRFLGDRYRDGYVVGALSAVSERVREVLTNATGG